MSNSDIVNIMAETRLISGSLVLKAISPDSIERLSITASGAIHASDYMPFGSPWSAGSPAQRSDRLRRWYAARLREASRDRWTLIFGVYLSDQIVGSTNLYADRFPEHRTVSTGSWLLHNVHGRGIGTRMRQMLLDLAFTHLNADRARSEAWEDNWPSRRVNEKCGYRLVGEYEKVRGDRVATMQQYELPRGGWTPEALTTVKIDPRLPTALL